MVIAGTSKAIALLKRRFTIMSILWKYTVILKLTIGFMSAREGGLTFLPRTKNITPVLERLDTRDNSGYNQGDGYE
jgi:hypothetical protein